MLAYFKGNSAFWITFLSIPNGRMAHRGAIFEEADPHNDRILVVNCWMAVKEAALLLGTLMACVPLGSSPDRSLLTVEQVCPPPCCSQYMIR